LSFYLVVIIIKPLRSPVVVAGADKARLPGTGELLAEEEHAKRAQLHGGTAAGGGERHRPSGGQQQGSQSGRANYGQTTHDLRLNSRVDYEVLSVCN